MWVFRDLNFLLMFCKMEVRMDFFNGFMLVVKLKLVVSCLDIVVVIEKIKSIILDMGVILKCFLNYLISCVIL